MRKVFYTLIGFLGIILITSGLFFWKSWSIQNDLVKIIKNENINNLTENSFLSKKLFIERIKHIIILRQQQSIKTFTMKIYHRVSTKALRKINMFF